jgi:SAM-dependent methyltransferase
VRTTPGDRRPRRCGTATLIARELLRLAPPRGRALEIASGSGEHVVRFASEMPGLRWQPTDPDPGQRASIAAWIAAEGSDNIAAPRALDVSQPGWAAEVDAADLVVLVNLLHLIDDRAVASALQGIADVLRPGGIAVSTGRSCATVRPRATGTRPSMRSCAGATPRSATRMSRTSSQASFGQV